MRLLHFAKGFQEYVTFIEDNDDLEDYRIGGYELISDCTVELGPFTVGSNTIPMGSELRRED